MACLPSEAELGGWALQGLPPAASSPGPCGRRPWRGHWSGAHAKGTCTRSPACFLSPALGSSGLPVQDPALRRHGPRCAVLIRGNPKAQAERGQKTGHVRHSPPVQSAPSVLMDPSLPRCLGRARLGIVHVRGGRCSSGAEMGGISVKIETREKTGIPELAAMLHIGAEGTARFNSKPSVRAKSRWASPGGLRGTSQSLPKLLRSTCSASMGKGTARGAECRRRR